MKQALHRAARVPALLLAVLALVTPYAAPGADEATVTIGIANTSSDVPFFIAQKLGYFAEAGIVPKFETFQSAAKMIAPLGVGQLDVGGGGPSAGLYNAIARGIDIKIVADKGSTPKGFGYMPLLVRKTLVESGKYRGPQDLRGMKVAESAQGSSSGPTIARMLKPYGMTYNDVQHVFMGFPEHVAAMTNGSIDASFTAEPSATLAVKRGVAVRALGDDQIYPNQQLAVLLYSGDFMRAKPQVAERFMIAYLKGVRYYNDALKGDRLRGRTAAEVIKILTASTALKDPELYREIVPQATDPNGRVNVASITEDYGFFKSSGVLQGNIDIEKIVDPSFAEAAVKKLGPYRPNR